MTAVTITGVLFDKFNKTQQVVTLMGELTQGAGPGAPPGIWPGPGDPDFPGGGKPPGQPPTIWPNPPEGIAPHPEHPIALPGDPWWPPDAPKPPQVPPPGSPPVIIPGTTPVHPIQPPPAIVVDYPGIGKVLVPQPTS